MSTTTSISTAASSRATRKILFIAAWTSGASGPTVPTRRLDLLGGRGEDPDPDREGRDEAEQAERDPEVAPVPGELADVVEHHRDAGEEHDQRRRREHPQPDPRGLPCDVRPTREVVLLLGDEGERGEQEAAADPDHREDDVDGLERQVPVGRGDEDDRHGQEGSADQCGRPRRRGLVGGTSGGGVGRGRVHAAT